MKSKHLLEFNEGKLRSIEGQWKNTVGKGCGNPLFKGGRKKRGSLWEKERNIFDTEMKPLNGSRSSAVRQELPAGGKIVNYYLQPEKGRRIGEKTGGKTP